MNLKPLLKECVRCRGPVETTLQEKNGMAQYPRIVLNGGAKGQLKYMGHGSNLSFLLPHKRGDHFICASCWEKEKLEYAAFQALLPDLEKQAEQARVRREETMAAEQAAKRRARELYRRSLWIEFYPKNGNTTRLEGIKHARINGQWVNVMAADGTHACFHCESFKTNLAPDDWAGGCNVPQYDDRYRGKGYAEMPRRFPVTDGDNEED